MIRKDLLAILENVKPAVSEKGLIPIFSTYCFDYGCVYAYNDKLGIVAPCDITESFAVNGNLLLGLVRNSKAKEVEFIFSGDDLEPNHVLVKASKSRIKLPYFTKDEFLFDRPSSNWLVETDLNEDFVNGIKLCLTTAGEDTSMPALMGITYKEYEGKSAFYSCDGDAISRFVLPVDHVKDLVLTLSSDFCRALLRLYQTVEDKNGSKFQISKDWVKVTFNNGYEIYGRVLENPELDHQALIEKTQSNEPVFIKPVKGLTEALSRARVLTDPESNTTQLSISDKRLKLYSETHLGTLRDTLPMTQDHAEIKVGINAALFQRSLQLCDSFSIQENCSCFKNGDSLFQIIPNMS